MAISKITEGRVEIVGLEDGEVVLRDLVKGGVTIITITGVFGGATVDIGFYDKNGVFVSWDAVDLPKTAPENFEMRVGNSHKLIVKVTGTTATTDIEVTSGLYI